MDKREARQYICAHPPFDPYYENARRPSFLGRLFSRSRSSSISEDTNMMTASMQRRGSIDPQDVPSLTQKVQQALNKRNSTSNEKVIFT